MWILGEQGVSAPLEILMELGEWASSTKNVFLLVAQVCNLPELRGQPWHKDRAQADVLTTKD